MRSRKFAIVNAGIKKEFKKQFGSLQLTVEDIFGSQRHNVKYGTVTEEVFNIRSDVILKTESAKFPMFRINYNVPLGNKTSTGKEKNFSEGEQERILK